MSKDERFKNHHSTHEIIPIPDIGPDQWPEIDEVGFSCFANMGRSILAEAIALAAIKAGRLPPHLRVFSGALEDNASRLSIFPPPVTIDELKRRGHTEDIFTLRTNPLRFHDVGEKTDLVFFVDGSVVQDRLYDHLGRYTKPRSIICVPLADPSSPPEGSTIEIEVSRTYDRLDQFINHELLGIIDNVRKGLYKSPVYPSAHMHEGIIYPFGFKLPELKFGGEL